MRPSIVLTGGPGGGKSALIEELAQDPAWRGSFLALPEAISVAGRVGIPPHERSFQKLMVDIQQAMEDSLARSLDHSDTRIILCHRGTLDPLAYWLHRGWPEDEFFTFTGTRCQDHYRRYTAVIHLVTAADGAAEHYTRWPEAHRPETPEESIKLDGLLEKVWHNHPCYYRLDNNGVFWEQKSRRAKDIIQKFL